MAVRIKIPTPLRKLTGQESEIEVEGETVGEVLEHLNEKYPTLKTHLYDAE
ncbi:MAG: molybdopterin synthase sulfur carrier subunit, partial [Deltaproteobacteria bacterium]